MGACAMAGLADIVGYTDKLLDCSAYRDACPNGLQVEGKSQVQHIVSGVTASQALLDAAVASGADAILVHHGYFWRGESPRLVGMKRRRLATLLHNDISLLAYHLPLDCHSLLGNNVQLANELQIDLDAPTIQDSVPPLVRTATLHRDWSGAEWARHVTEVLGRAPLHIDAARPIRSIALCTGAAQGEIDVAIAASVDAYLSGEVSEQTVHSARENGIHYFAAGHHATERFGVKALGAHLAEKFSIGHEFIDCDNPV